MNDNMFANCTNEQLMEIAYKLGIPYMTLYQWRCGRTKAPAYVYKLIKFALEYLGESTIDKALEE